MTQEDKDLLSKDICSRIPYGVKVLYNEKIYKISIVSICNETITIYGERGYPIEVEIQKVKPYLFPISSMTEEQKKELDETLVDLNLKVLSDKISSEVVSTYEIDFYNKNHFDCRGIIEKSLALDATGLNIY